MSARDLNPLLNDADLELLHLRTYIEGELMPVINKRMPCAHELAETQGKMFQLRDIYHYVEENYD